MKLKEKEYFDVTDLKNKDFLDDYVKIAHIYEAGIKEIKTKLEILDSEFKIIYDHNPIHHIESRLKKPKSIIHKAMNKGLDLNFDSITNNIYDIAGIRVICNYEDDVYRVAELLMNQSDIETIRIKDYIKNPKDNGYRSLHLVLQIPIFLSSHVKPICVEVQLRTIAMDFWASLEHKLRYKTNNLIDDDVKNELYECALEIASLDSKMQKIHNKVNLK